jgi:hypothetical protein
LWSKMHWSDSAHGWPGRIWPSMSKMWENMYFFKFMYASLANPSLCLE